MELEKLLFVATLLVGALIVIALVFGSEKTESWIAPSKFLDKSGLENLGATITTRSWWSRFSDDSADQLVLLIVAGKRLMLQRYSMAYPDSHGDKSGKAISLKLASSTGGGAQIIDDGTYELDDREDTFMVFDDNKIYLHLVRVP